VSAEPHWRSTKAAELPANSPPLSGWAKCNASENEHGGEPRVGPQPPERSLMIFCMVVSLSSTRMYALTPNETTDGEKWCVVAVRMCLPV